ncbi:hypothetical protein BCV70DRAFT_15540 [Testicularia cyperi]|uniref:Uncharacterized protein n=1 Tax=Testicularia cyperi TaxID=1882483 RepID=A0A317XYI5_9BASI|nr:hypothetical protein BCV70DRAFT_15540 [Testicularia cyperi]
MLLVTSSCMYRQTRRSGGLVQRQTSLKNSNVRAIGARAEQCTNASCIYEPPQCGKCKTRGLACSGRAPAQQADQEGGTRATSRSEDESARCCLLRPAVVLRRSRWHPATCHRLHFGASFAFTSNQLEG